MPERTLISKIDRATKVLSDLQPVLIAVSGGIDSRFLAEIAKREGMQFGALFFSGAQTTPAERKFAYHVLAELNRPFYVLKDFPLIGLKDSADNKLRCYFCKQYLFSRAWQVAFRHGYASLAEGSNASDRGQHRPGRRALNELKVASPLDSAGLQKDEIRSLARYLGLRFPEQPSRPCLLTRFPYGYLPDIEELHQLGKAEDILCAMGFTDFRLRMVKKDSFLLQLSLAEDKLWSRSKDQALFFLKDLGLSVLKVDISENVSGYYDK